MEQRTGWSPEEQIDAGAAGYDDPLPDDDIPTIEVLRQLVEEGRAYARAEAAKQKLRGQLLGAAARNIAILCILALFLVIGIVVTAMVAAIVGLSPVVGWAVATLIVCGVAIVLVAILLISARGIARAASRAAFGNGAGQ